MMYNLDFVLTALADTADEADRRGLYSEADDITSLLITLSKFSELRKEAYIKRVQVKGKTKYEVKSKKNPDWSGGTYSALEAAKERLKEVEKFKHMKKKK